VASSEPASLAAAYPEIMPKPNGDPARFDWAQAWLSAGISVLASIFLMLLGMHPAFGMLPAGFLSVILYHRKRPLSHLTAWKGARVGVLTGGLGFGVLALMLILVTVLGSGKDIHDAFVKYFQQYAAQSADPRLQPLLDQMKTPDGYVAVLVAGLVGTLVIFLLFAGIGGAIAAYLLHRRERP
jgi:hypothetical protein